MVKSYCVKQKKQTECVPGSEQYAQAKNGRTMMKCTCAECGITKTKFINSGTIGGAIRKKSTGPYCGIKKVPSGRKRGTVDECINSSQVRYYGLHKLPEITKKEKDELLHKLTKKDKNKVFDKLTKKNKDKLIDILNQKN